MTALTREGFPKLKGEYFGRMIALSAEPSFTGLTNLTSIEVLRENGSLAFKILPFMTIVYIIKVLKAEEVLL